VLPGLTSAGVDVQGGARFLDELEASI
jgi:hypothetical protein